jgi:protein SCO1
MKTIISGLLVVTLWSCTDPVKKEFRRLPYYGPHEYLSEANGSTDTVFYTIPKFSFINQDSIETHQDQYQGKPFIAEFFFSNCRSICPAITSQLARLQAMMRADGILGEVNILSHTVDPTNDNPARLREYAGALGVDPINWQFVTGPAEDLYYQASKGYFVPAFPSDTAQGGFFHTDQLTLIDGDFHIRGYYDGTSTLEVDSMYQDIKNLIRENKKTQ